MATMSEAQRRAALSIMQGQQAEYRQQRRRVAELSSLLSSATSVVSVAGRKRKGDALGSSRKRAKSEPAATPTEALLARITGSSGALEQPADVEKFIDGMRAASEVTARCQMLLVLSRSTRDILRYFASARGMTHLSAWLHSFADNRQALAADRGLAIVERVDMKVEDARKNKLPKAVRALATTFGDTGTCAPAAGLAAAPVHSPPAA